MHIAPLLHTQGLKGCKNSGMRVDANSSAASAHGR